MVARRPPTSPLFWSVAGLLCSVAYVYSPSLFGTTQQDGMSIDGRQFPATLTVGGVTQSLVGGGTRVKYGVAKVYAVALFLEVRSASSSLRKFSGAVAPTKQPKFYDAIIKGGFTKTLHIIMHRPVGSETMVSALNEALSKRVSAAAVEIFREAFLKALPTDTLARGDGLSLMCKGNTLSIHAGGALQRISPRGLCGALFDVYFGKSPVSPAAKEGVAVGFHHRQIGQM